MLAEKLIHGDLFRPQGAAEGSFTYEFHHHDNDHAQCFGPDGMVVFYKATHVVLLSEKRWADKE